MAVVRCAPSRATSPSSSSPSLADLRATTARSASRAGSRSRIARAGRGQGYLADAEKRSALEWHAVQMAIQHYRAIGATEIEERGKPYDLRLTMNGVERHVAVKGSVGEDLDSVQLTHRKLTTLALTNQRISLWLMGSAPPAAPTVRLLHRAASCASGASGRRATRPFARLALDTPSRH
jgi:hypothetical protein